MDTHDTQRAGMWIQPDTRDRLKAAVSMFQVRTGKVQSYDTLIDYLLDKYENEIKQANHATA